MRDALLGPGFRLHHEPPHPSAEPSRKATSYAPWNGTTDFDLWMAYPLQEGEPEPLLREPGDQVGRRISEAGGYEPRWRRDGRELFYVDPSGGLMSVSVEGAAFGRPRELFRVECSPASLISTPCPE